MNASRPLGSGGESPLERSEATGADCAAPACVQWQYRDGLAVPIKAKTASTGPWVSGGPPPCQEKGSEDVGASSEPESHLWGEKTVEKDEYVNGLDRVKGSGVAPGPNARSASAQGDAGILGGAAALPCQNSNNSDKPTRRYRLKSIPGTDFCRQPGNDQAVWRKVDGDLIQRFGMPSSSEAKAAFHLRVNVDSFVKRYERLHCAFFTTSDMDNLHPLEFARRWNSFLRRNIDWMRSFIRCLEPQKNGRPHYHSLVSVNWDLRPDSFDWEAFFACEGERRTNGYTARFRELRAKYRESASPELVEMWAHLRKTLPKYGLGRSEILPMRKGPEQIAEYIGKYLEAGLTFRRHSWKGCRRVEFDRRGKNTWLCCSRIFAWHSPGMKTWRTRVGELAGALGVEDMDGLKKKLGPRWAYRSRQAITQSSEADWKGFLSLVAEAEGNTAMCALDKV